MLTFIRMVLVDGERKMIYQIILNDSLWTRLCKM